MEGILDSADKEYTAESQKNKGRSGYGPPYVNGLLLLYTAFS